MVLGISAMFVVTVAEFSSFLSILAVLLCFFAMFLLIVRNMTVFWLHGEEIMFGSSVHTVQQKIPQMKMMKVHIPFTFKLQETSRSSFSVFIRYSNFIDESWRAFCLRVNQKTKPMSSYDLC
ncbi:uncharacterized protein LOC103514984 isoform X2 [Diaphorina citri]|uniref:Uncharacterized protein LOC103514984 isoform X2 n=1 Tax=Diaphorina citri TaxID=121845 RepID=A0A3Q0JA63_DIACI|nr:uncharacterized protein LOC103514984 isoform X2 [Diaphorina citri]